MRLQFMRENRRPAYLYAALVVAAVTLVVGVTAEGNSWTRDDMPADPCRELLEAIYKGGDVEALVSQYGLPTDIPVPSGTRTGKRLCGAEQPDAGEGEIIGLAVVDATGENIWVVLGDTPSAEADMLSMAAAEGFRELHPTPYGFTSRSAASHEVQTVSLWAAVEISIEEAREG